MEAFDEAGDAVDGQDSLLSQESVADLILGVLMVRSPDVLCERTVLREFDDGTGLSELGRAVFLGGWGYMGRPGSPSPPPQSVPVGASRTLRWRGQVGTILALDIRASPSWKHRTTA